MQSPVAEKSTTTEQRPESPLEPDHQEPGWGEAQPVEITANLYRRILAIVANVLVLAEVFVAMYFAAQDMDEITPIFFKVFFSLLIPTIIGIIIARRVISARFKE